MKLTQKKRKKRKKKQEKKKKAPGLRRGAHGLGWSKAQPALGQNGP